MRRNKTHKRGRVPFLGKFQVRFILALIACGVAYLSVGSRTVALRSADLSAAETVALRFPDNWDNAPAVPRVLVAAIGTAHAPDDAASTLFNPKPMMPQANLLHAAMQSSAQNNELDSRPSAKVKVAAADAAVPQASPQLSAPVQVAVLATATNPASGPVREPRVAIAAVRHVVNRPGYMLNDAQIASIKARLHLTPDQEHMWPSVEVALRNMAYTRTQAGRSSATRENAAVDPDSVQGLKSAAVPLIMSFSTEQKDEVRNIVHVMGLDQLASQF
jgi:hypothetical protein